ncbi:MAG: response regulator, partial [Lachnospiraceae bacterium]|nr:response regulator [Lachnospiraceae bacterium]
MYTVLLADDEGSVLDVLKSSVNWQELGVETLLTAQDGMAALECFKKDKRIDLAIVDIQMPRMDGLELIRRVKNISPHTHFIVLTAYGEFSYAQASIRLGVENYLLKPVSKGEVEQTVRNALENIYQERQSTEFLLLENTLRRWTQGNIGSEELSDRASVLGINLYQAAYCVICIVRRGNDSIALFRSVCLETLQELRCDTYSFWDEKNHYVIIAGGKGIDEQILGKRLSEAIRDKNAGHLAALAVGTPVGDADSLHLSYQTAMDAVELADPENIDVVLNIAENRIGIDEDLLAEELRLIFFMQDRESRENGFRHLLMKLEREGWAPVRGKRLARGCIRVLVNEFPN